MISYNYCEPICQLYQDAYILYFARRNKLSREKGSVYEELVITNFDPIPVMTANAHQLTMFDPLTQEQGELMLVHVPGQPLSDIPEIILNHK